jgi:hypothetical protein
LIRAFGPLPSAMYTPDSKRPIDWEAGS